MHAHELIAGAVLLDADSDSHDADKAPACLQVPAVIGTAPGHDCTAPLQARLELAQPSLAGLPALAPELRGPRKRQCKAASLRPGGFALAAQPSAGASERLGQVQERRYRPLQRAVAS